MNTFQNKRTFGRKVRKVSSVGCLHDRLNAVYYVPPVIESFFAEEQADGSVTLTSDITMLFNQQRLDRMSRDAILSHFDSMAVKDDSLSVLKSKLTNDQLCHLVKSRYIQTPSELMSYSKYLVSRYDQLDAEVRDLLSKTDVNTDLSVKSDTENLSNQS